MFFKKTLERVQTTANVRSNIIENLENIFIPKANRSGTILCEEEKPETKKINI